MKAVLQVSTGLFGHCTAEDPAAAGKKIDELMSRLPVRAVIYGWGRRAGLFETIVETAHRHGAEAFLWLPVFADVRDPEKADPMVFFGDTAGKRVITCPGEEFQFVCPGSEKNRTAAMKAFDSLTEECKPDGVFLDRIRYPSAVFSPVHFFGCGCAVCREKQKQAGTDPDRLQRKIREKESLAWCAPDSLEKGQYRYQDPDLDCLARTKRERISETVEFFAREFHGRGLRIGIDVFAPALADLVGQDLARLLAAVDFMKPMMYFRTMAPAGIPCELKGYGEEISRRLSELWGLDIGGVSSMERQLGWLEEGVEKVYPGIEVNRIPGICEPDGAGFRQAVRAAKAAGCDTVVLSWNVLQAREEEIREMEACLREE